LGHGKQHIPKLRNGPHSQISKSHNQDTASSKIVAKFKGAKDFPHFVKLPYEIQHRIWEMSAQEPRVVAVYSKSNIGLRSSIPPILHVCSQSRAIGLKNYTLAFEPQRSTQPPRVFFNFERDTLYFREDWNKDVKGAWCCISQFTYLVNEGDLKRVKRAGFDVDVRICSLETSGEECHIANFAHWNALQILYLGYEDARLGSDCPISFSELDSKDYKDFMHKYRKNPCWRNDERLPQDDEAAIEYLRKEVPIMYHGFLEEPDFVHDKLELVSITHL
jgi:hypothetical protein